MHGGSSGHAYPVEEGVDGGLPGRYARHVGPNLTKEQLERVKGELRAMIDALAAVEAAHELSERKFHWDQYFAHEGQIHRLIPPKSETPAPML